LGAGLMSHQLLAAFVVFAIATLFNPGPNNIMLMTSGLNFGFARTLPHAFGVALGFGFLVLVVGLGLGAVFAAYPAIYAVLKFAGAAYLLYLAWRIAIAGPVAGSARGRPLTFLEGAAFQWINPKGWVMAIGAVTAYAAIARFPLNIVLIAAIFTGFGTLSSWTWLLFGTGLKAVVTDPEKVRVFNIVMALALAASLVPVFLEG
jgi:threonine/homoserine/homoserine lactone efflux protein